MSCSNPSRIYVMVNLETGELEYHFAGPAKDTAAKALSMNADNPLVVDVLNIPCRHCVGCRLDYSRDWANRMLLEYQHSKKAVFVTLTYNNDFVPFSDSGCMTLSKRDCQLFMKRLRKAFSGTEIRFFLGGEYGPLHGRPHYHAILFGLSLSDFGQLVVRDVNELGQPSFQSSVLDSIWTAGFSTISDVSFQTFAYCARYVLKKQKLKDYMKDDQVLYTPEFSLMSRKPGLGAYFITNDFLDGINCTVSDGHDVKTFPLPSSLLKLLKDVNPQKYAELKKSRKDLADDRLALELSSSDLSFLDYLKLKEDKLLARTAVIRNRKEL